MRWLLSLVAGIALSCGPHGRVADDEEEPVVSTGIATSPADADAGVDAPTE